VSRTFGVDHAESILAWHCLNIFPEDIYYMEALDTAVIFRMKQHQIRLYDVIGKSTPELQQVVGSIVPAIHPAESIQMLLILQEMQSCGHCRMPFILL